MKMTRKVLLLVMASIAIFPGSSNVVHASEQTRARLRQMGIDTDVETASAIARLHAVREVQEALVLNVPPKVFVAHRTINQNVLIHNMAADYQARLLADPLKSNEAIAADILAGH